jgi:hypothetical protein
LVLALGSCASTTAALSISVWFWLTPVVAWRIHESVVRGVVDNRVLGQVTGKLWLAGRGAPVQLKLRGNAWRDLAGCLLSFEHTQPQSLQPTSLGVIQEGVVGDLTASRKCKMPTIPMDAVKDYYARHEPIPFQWANVLYLEWFSERNGRVVLETSDFTLHISEHVWTMSPHGEAEQQKANAAALRDFMRRLIGG